MNGYVSGCHFYEPSYRLEFERLKLHDYKEIKLKESATRSSTQRSSKENTNNTEDSEERFARIRKDKRRRFGTFHFGGDVIDYSPEDNGWIFPQGIFLEADDGSRIEADYAVMWMGNSKEPSTLYLEGHVRFQMDVWDINFKSLILNANNEGIGWQPRLVTRNPKGILGAGRGTNVLAVMKADSLILHPTRTTYLKHAPKRGKNVEVTDGRAILGETHNYPHFRRSQQQFL